MILLQPTSPLRSEEDITRSLELLCGKRDTGAVVSVCEAVDHPMHCGILPEDGNMGNFLLPNAYNKNRQELPLYYKLNGAIYVAFWEYLKRNKNFIGEKTYAYVMPRERSVDVDTEIDLFVAEYLMRKINRDRT